MGKNRANLMFHVEHCKTQKSAKSKIADFFFFQKNHKKSKIMLDFMIFLARGRQ